MTNLELYLSRERGRASALARAAGVSKGGLSSIKSGKARPSPDLAKRIETATGGEVTAASLLGIENAAPESRARPLNDGRWFAPVGTDSPVELPAELLLAFGFEPGDAVIFRRTDDGVLMSSQRKAIRRIQDELAKLVRPGESIVDELIAERRAEAARE
jgi:transcriptional regulator with XRE-family HTH domain